MTDERWQRILRIMDEAFEEYLTGMAALRGRVVTDLKRKVSDSQVLDPPPLEQSSAPARRASRARHGVRGAADLGAEVRWTGSARSHV